MSVRHITSLALIVLTGCAAQQSPSPSATMSPSAEASISSEPSPSPVATSTSTPQATPKPPPSAAAVERCEDRAGGYAIWYPSEWYSNAGIADWDDCGLFAPEAFATSDDPAIAIRLIAAPNLGWNDPFHAIEAQFEDLTVLTDEETTVGGRRAWLREFEALTDIEATQAVGDRQLAYDVDLGNGWYVNATTAMTAPEDYAALSAVLVEMVESLEVLDAQP